MRDSPPLSVPAACFNMRLEVGEQVEDLVHALLPGACADHAADPEVLEDGEIGKDALLLRDVGDATRGGLVAGEMGDVDAVEADGARHEWQQARHRRQERRLAGAVGTEDREDLLADGEVEALEDLHSMVAAAQAADLDGGRAGAPQT